VAGGWVIGHLWASDGQNHLNGHIRERAGGNRPGRPVGGGRPGVVDSYLRCAEWPGSSRQPGSSSAHSGRTGTSSWCGGSPTPRNSWVRRGALPHPLNTPMAGVSPVRGHPATLVRRPETSPGFGATSGNARHGRPRPATVHARRGLRRRTGRVGDGRPGVDLMATGAAGTPLLWRCCFNGAAEPGVGSVGARVIRRESPATSTGGWKWTVRRDAPSGRRRKRPGPPAAGGWCRT
jgi:hypothetical protein